MSELTIKTNNRWRDPIYWHELTEKERKEFDYLDTDERQIESTFFRYRGNVYDLREFMRVNDMTQHAREDSGFASWHGYQSDSYFSGILIRFNDDCDQIQVATYFC